VDTEAKQQRAGEQMEEIVSRYDAETMSRLQKAGLIGDRDSYYSSVKGRERAVAEARAASMTAAATAAGRTVESVEDLRRRVADDFTPFLERAGAKLECHDLTAALERHGLLTSRTTWTALRWPHEFETEFWFHIDTDCKIFPYFREPALEAQLLETQSVEFYHRDDDELQVEGQMTKLRRTKGGMLKLLFGEATAKTVFPPDEPNGKKGWLYVWVSKRDVHETTYTRSAAVHVDLDDRVYKAPVEKIVGNRVQVKLRKRIFQTYRCLGFFAMIDLIDSFVGDQSVHQKALLRTVALLPRRAHKGCCLGCKTAQAAKEASRWTHLRNEVRSAVGLPLLPATFAAPADETDGAPT
jgi:hypothetical protein